MGTDAPGPAGSGSRWGRELLAEVARDPGVLRVAPLTAAQEAQAPRVRAPGGSYGSAARTGRRPRACASALMRLNASPGVRPSALPCTAPYSIWWSSPATRTSKNSSRLEQEMQRKRSRSRSGVAGSRALLEHPPVERELAELPVDVEGGVVERRRLRDFGFASLAHGLDATLPWPARIPRPGAGRAGAGVINPPRTLPGAARPWSR